MRVKCTHPAGVVLPGDGALAFEGEADLSEEQAANLGVRQWLEQGFLAPVDAPEAEAGAKRKGRGG